MFRWKLIDVSRENVVPILRNEEVKQETSMKYCSLTTSVDFLLGLFFDVFLRNVGWLSTEYTALCPRRYNSPFYIVFTVWQCNFYLFGSGNITLQESSNCANLRSEPIVVVPNNDYDDRSYAHTISSSRLLMVFLTERSNYSFDIFGYADLWRKCVLLWTRLLS
jgi:hypothetical protein